MCAIEMDWFSVLFFDFFVSFCKVPQNSEKFYKLQNCFFSNHLLFLTMPNFDPERKHVQKNKRVKTIFFSVRFPDFFF